MLSSNISRKQISRERVECVVLVKPPFNRLKIGNIIASDASLWREVDLTYISRKLHIAPFSPQRLSSAESLMIYGLFDMPPKSIDKLLGFAARNNPRLISVTFRSAVDLPSKAMRSLWKSATNLRHVDLSWCLQIRNLPILSLIIQCPTLLSLNLSHTKITRIVLRGLHKLEYLTDLSLEGCFRPSMNDMRDFIQSGLPPRLSRLNLSYLYSIKGEWLVQMSSRVTLKLLDVRYAEWITRSDIRKMSQRWGNKCQILTSARLETDDERGWKQFVDELVEADVV